MSDGNEPRNGEFEITPEEDRFLRAYFHRHARRYLASLGLTAIAAVCATLALTRAAVLDEIRSDSEQLRGGLTELRRQVGSQAEDASARVAALEKRLAAALQRFERVEQQAEAKPAAPALAAAPVAADSIAASDLNSILERLYNLEVRQDEQESKRESSEKDLLERMFQVEDSREQLASARGETERSMRERLSSLESRAFQLEKSVSGSGASPPAAPAP
jgi:hypothetical protein